VKSRCRRNRRGGFTAGVIAALEDADVTLVGYTHQARRRCGDEIKARFGAGYAAADGSDDAKKATS